MMGILGDTGHFGDCEGYGGFMYSLYLICLALK